MTPFEIHIAKLLKAHDKRAIEMIYDHYGDALYGVVLRIVGIESIAEDVVQDAFVKIWKKGPSFDSRKGSLFTWVLNICRNTAIDVIRSSYFKNLRKTQEVDSKVKTNLKHSCSLNEDQIGLHKIVDNLDVKYREVIDLIYFKGYTQREVEQELNIPLGTVKTRVKIGLRELRRIFADHSEDIIFTIFLIFSV